MMELPSLSADDFPTFFRAVQTWTGEDWDPRYGTFDPFPWQARLIGEINNRGRWPDLLDLPTSSGKTVALDIAVFHLALQAGLGEARRAAMRIAFVVDRRLVVDEAFARAGRLAAALQSAADGAEGAPEIVRRVALRLKSLAGESAPPLIARSLRGGAPREDDWARTPCQPTLLCSTVDQVGSRLLFRGYGVSDRMKPLQAGLLGSDALILLDEAHLSQPFRQTARAIANVPALRGADAERTSFQVSLLTATPGETSDGDEWRFALGTEDHENPTLAKRLSASKPTVLHEVGAADKVRAAATAAQASRLINDLKSAGVAAPIVGVVVNRIARARDIVQILSAEHGNDAATLIIGRARPIDREPIAKQLDPIKTGVEPRPDKSRIIVATQTVEVGVDIDLDALVTDAASLDALRQRFGRVNRAGRSLPARGVIIADKIDRNEKKPDAIYGVSIAKTLSALFPSGEETVDFGIRALSETLESKGLVGAEITPLLSDKADAPILMPAHVDLWTHTSPITSADPEVGLFLHGPDREPASVQVVWRADLDLAVGDERLRSLLALAPPRAAEAIELPVWAARAWLSGAGADVDLADAAQEGVQAGPERALGKLAFRWKGADDDRSRVVGPDSVRPGDMIVVPSRYGGCDQYGWDPNSTDPTADVCDEASAPYSGRRFVVRISAGLIHQAVVAESAANEADPSETKDMREERLASKAERVFANVRSILADPALSKEPIKLAQSLAAVLPTEFKMRLEALTHHKGRGLERPAFPYGVEDGEPLGVVLVAPFGIFAGKPSTEGGDVSTEDDDSGSFTGCAQSLLDHSAQVETLARNFARSVGLSPSMVEDLSLAGWLHDAGKADLRFQRLLYDGDLMAMEAGEPLAKSERGRAAAGGREYARLPNHWRHEALSVRLALQNARLHEAHDRALVLWLVGVHHGHGRPFFPHIDQMDTADRDLAVVDNLCNGRLLAGAGPQSLGFAIPEDDLFAPRQGREMDDDLRGLDWPTMFRDLKRRYGPWGLPRLEAVLRLADHRASEAARNLGAPE